MDFKLTLIVILMIVSVVLFSLIALSFISAAKKYEARKKRLDQLKFKEDRDLSVEEAIEKITNFVDMYILKLKPSPKDKQTEIKLRMVGWDKYFGYKEWKAVKIFMGIVGIVVMSLLYKISAIYAAFVGITLMVVAPVFFHLEVEDKRTKILDKFPDLIIITEGYLAAGFTLSKAMEEAIPFSGKTWGPILKKLVADMELMGVDHALSELKASTNVAEVREFASLVKIAYEQGDVGESFTSQAERMRTIQEDLMMTKIGRRKSLATTANLPVLLSVFLLIGAPAVAKVMEISSTTGL